MGRMHLGWPLFSAAFRCPVVFSRTGVLRPLMARVACLCPVGAIARTKLVRKQSVHGSIGAGLYEFLFKTST